MLHTTDFCNDIFDEILDFLNLTECCKLSRVSTQFYQAKRRIRKLRFVTKYEFLHTFGKYYKSECETLSITQVLSCFPKLETIITFNLRLIIDDAFVRWLRTRAQVVRVASVNKLQDAFYRIRNPRLERVELWNDVSPVSQIFVDVSACVKYHIFDINHLVKLGDTIYATTADRNSCTELPPESYLMNIPLVTNLQIQSAEFQVDNEDSKYTLDSGCTLARFVISETVRTFTLTVAHPCVREIELVYENRSTDIFVRNMTDHMLQISDVKDFLIPSIFLKPSEETEYLGYLNRPRYCGGDCPTVFHICCVEENMISFVPCVKICEA